MKVLGEKIERFLDIVGNVCEVVCSILVLFMVFLVTLQVILRFFNMPLFGIEELLTFPTIWVYFLGGACAAYTNSHIECGIVKAVSKNKHAVQITEIVCNIVASALAIYVFDWAIQYSIHSLEIGKKSAVLGIPMPIGELAILTGLTLMCVYTLVGTVKNIVKFKEKWEEGGNRS